jgi:hypothetical protein
VWVVESRPGQSAPKSGWYQLIKPPGAPTGHEIFVELGHVLPDAATGFAWRLKRTALSQLSPGQLLERAAQMRALGQTARTPETARGLLRLADRFEKMAATRTR